MKLTSSLRKRWLINTLGVIVALGMVCVLAITALFSNYYYSNMRSDLKGRAESTADFFAEYLNQSYNEYYQSCINYAQSFSDKDRLELQFISKDRGFCDSKLVQLFQLGDMLQLTGRALFDDQLL